MGKKKIQSILAMSAMVGVAPVIAHYGTEKQNNVVLESKSNPYFVNKITGEESNQSNIKDNNKEENHTTNLAVESGSTETNGQNNTSINYAKDLQIDVTNVSIQKAISGGTTTNTEYKPENVVPTTGTIANNSTIVNYQISVSLRSKTGKFYPVDSAYLTSTPLVQYLNKAGDNPEEKKIEQQLALLIYKRLGELKNLNSTSTFTISASFQLDNTDWNVNVKPNIVLNLKMPNGEVIKEKVKVPSIKETNQYTYTIRTFPSLVPDKNNQHVHYMNIGVGRWVSGDNSESPGVYNPMNQNLKSVTFRINNPNPKDITITPLDIPGLVKNANGTYTISRDLINSGKNLFKVTTTTDKALMDTINVTPVGQVTQSPLNIDSSAATVTYYSGGSVQLTQQNLNAHFTISQTSVPGQTEQQGYIYNNNLVTYGTSISSGLSGKYNIYTGSLVTNGQIVVSNANASINLINNDDTYCHLDDNAVNILKNGTPAQKAQIMDDIISDNMSGIGTKYSASQIQEMVNSGKPIPILNFIYGEKVYNGSSLSTSESYETAPLDGSSVPVISRTITVGKLVGNYTPEEQQNMEEELKDGQLPSDGVITSDGKLQGFILSPPNKYTDSVVQSQGIGQITDTRYGSYSHGLSSARCSGSFEVGVTIDNLGTGSSNTVNTAKGSWLGKVHQINVLIQGNGTGAPLYFNNSKITVNFGHPFKLVGPLYIGNVELTPSQYKIEGDKLIMDVNKSMQQVLSSAPDIMFNMQYTNINNFKGQLDINANVSGPGQSKGMDYEYNNITVPAEKGGMPTEQNYSTKILITNAISNSCFHMYDGLHGTDSNDLTTTLTDNVKNNNDFTKQYYIIGEIPGASKDTLPNNDGEPDVGGLGSQLQSLNTGGQPTWVLPKSALNAKNQALLASPTGNDLGGVLQYVESPGSGWIKYKPGMDLSNIVGYFTDAKVAPNDAYNMTYKIKLTNVQNGTYQLVHSAFKYYDATDNIGSTSNIVSITTPNEINGQGWNSMVKVVGPNADAKLTPQEQKNLDEIVSKLTGHGPDLVPGTFSPTPQKLMNEVTYANDQKELAKLGYKLVSTTVNTVNRDENWFNTVGIWQNKEHTEVVFNIERITPTIKTAQTTVTENYSNGKPVVSSVTTTNDIGSKVNTGLPKLPDGYKVTKITVNGKVVTSNEVPTTQSENNQTIVYTIGKIPTYKDIVNVVEKTPDGEKVISTESSTGVTGKDTGLEAPTIPQGYKVISITNSEGDTVTGVPNTFGDKNQTITYTIGKIINDKVEVVEHTSDGDKIISTQEVSGVNGENTNLKVPEIPTGYHVESITVNNVNKGDVVTLPNTFGNTDQTIIYNIYPNIKDKTYITVKTNKGDILVPSKEVASGKPGEVETINNSYVPKGYEVTKVTINGKEVEPSKDHIYSVINSSDNTKEVDNNIVVTVNKIVSTTVKEVTTDGKIISTRTIKGIEGEKVNTGLPVSKSGYKVVKITVDNKEVNQNSVPTEQGSEDQTIIYTIGKVLKDTVKVIGPNNQEFGKEQIVSGVEGENTGLQTPKIPEGYHVVSITNNGDEVTTGVPNKFTDTDQNVVYHIIKNVTTTVEEKYENGTDVVPVKVTTNNIGAKVNTGLPELPKGYQVTKITVNNKEVTQNEVPNTQGSKDQVIIYTIGKQPTDTIKVVNEKGIQVGKTISVTGDIGSKTGLEVPTIPKGYHVVSETINGKEGTGVPSTFGNSNTNIIYHIAPNVKDETYGSIVTDAGKTLVPVTPLNQGEPGSKVTVQMPNVPEGYKIVKVTINGKEVTPNKDNKYEVTYNSNVSKEVDNNIIITVKHVPVQDTVKVMEGNKVISTTTTKEGMPGDKVNITTPDIPNGYHIENITVDGKIVTTVPKIFGNNNQTVIYHLIENQANDIKADVVTESGKVLVKDTVVAEGPEGSNVTCDKTEIPAGYHLDKVLYDGKVISTITGGKVIYILPNTIPTGKEGQLTYVVSPNTSTVNVKVIGGQEPHSYTTTGTVGSNITGDTPQIPKGYKIVNITVNGHTVSEKHLPKVFGNKDYNIVYHITKIPTGEIKQEVVTDNGTIVEQPTVVANGEVGQDTNLKPYTPPKGYHIVKVIIDGKNTLTFNGNKLTAKEEEDMIHNLPNSITNQTQTVKYVIAKNVVKPIAQKGQITITIINSSTGQEIGNQIIYSGNVGSDTPNINNEVNNILGNKYTINNITYNGNVVTENGVPKTYSKGQNELVYNVSPKEGTLKYEIFVNGIPDVGGTLSGTPGEVAKYKLLDNKDLKLKNVTVNGVPVTGDIENYHGKYEVGGETVVYHYVYVPQTTPTGNNTPSKGGNTTPSHDNGDNTPSKPNKGDNTQNKGDNTPSGNVNHNGGNTTPSQSGGKGNTSNKGDNTPSKGGNTTPSHDNGDNTPSKPNKGDNTPSGNVNHNGGNTTPSQSGDKGNTSNKGDNTPSKGGNTTPSHDNGDNTPSKPNKGDNTQNKGDNTPSGNVNHNGGNTTPSQSGDKGNTPNKGDNTPSKGGNTTPSHDSGDNTPSKPNKGDNTPSGNVNHNGGNTTPSQSGDKGNTSNKGDNTPSKGGNTTPSHDSGDNTPSKPNKGDNTPSGNVNHNGGNTAPSQSGDKGNTSNKGDNTPSKGGNTTPSHDNGDNTPSKPNKGNNTPSGNKDTNNGGSTKTSTSTHTEVTGGGEAHSTGTASNTVPNVVSGGNNGNTVTPHVVVNTTGSNGITPVVSNSTSSNGVVSNNTTTSNGNDTTPFNSSSVSSSAGSTYTDNNLVNGPNEDNSTAQTVLPHTGLSTQGVENTAEQAGVLAGIMAMLGGAFFFRRKK